MQHASAAAAAADADARAGLISVGRATDARAMTCCYVARTHTR